jgi:dolichyl-phosphate beta-glucosyltransferase
MISLIIPCYNEEKRLPKTLEKISDFLRRGSLEWEVIVVDDASTDTTAAVAETFRDKFSNFRVIRLEKNSGKGAAVKTGFLESKGDIVIFSDADLSTPIEESGKILKKIYEGYDIAIGSRALRRELVRKHASFLREVLGRSANLLIQTVAVKGISDTQCGFKAFKRERVLNIFAEMKINRFAFDIEILFLAQREGLKICEVPVLWFHDEASKVNPIKDTLSSLKDLFKIRLIHADPKFGLVDKLLSIF